MLDVLEIVKTRSLSFHLVTDFVRRAAGTTHRRRPSKRHITPGYHDAAHKVETSVLLIQGELDFIPIRQSEEFFRALFRQDKRVRLLRNAGEGHTISDRANVLDMWKQMEAWLPETMAPRKAP